MSQPFFSPLAESDLAAILAFIARDKPQAAQEWVEKIRDKCSFLAANPQVGEDRSDIAPGLSSYSLRKYVIYFRRCSDRVEIVRVMHGARLLP